MGWGVGGGEGVSTWFRRIDRFGTFGRFFSSVKWRADVLMPSLLFRVLGRTCLPCVLFLLLRGVHYF